MPPCCVVGSDGFAAGRVVIVVGAIDRCRWSTIKVEFVAPHPEDVVGVIAVDEPQLLRLATQQKFPSPVAFLPRFGLDFVHVEHFWSKDGLAAILEEIADVLSGAAGHVRRKC